MWIYERPDWPRFGWDGKKIYPKTFEIATYQGILLGMMDRLGFDFPHDEFNLRALTDDVVKSSAIEGEHINPEEVRSSIASRLGMNIENSVPISRNVEGIVHITLDATQKFSEPLTKERLFSWHAALFPKERSNMKPITVGDWRSVEIGPMQVISEPNGRKKVHFEAPDASRLDKEIEAFLSWFNCEDTTYPILHAGIAHLWFVTIHPFEDGNGRIARAISDMALARAPFFSKRIYSLSAQIKSEQKQYYNQLEKQQRGTLDITNWLEWFLDCLLHAISPAGKTVENALFKAHLWKEINQQPVNERQKLIINRMSEIDFKGHMNTSKYAKIVKCSKDTASRDIQNLKSRKIFIQNPGGGRSTSYRLPENDTPSIFPPAPKMG